MITSAFVMPVIAVTTLGTIISIALGFLPRPSRATVLWASSFVIAMVGSYVWLAYELLDSEQLRAIGSALTITPIALLWAGVRAYRRRDRPYVWVACTFLVVMPLMLLGSTFINVYGIAFRVLFSASAVFAALIVWELAKLGPRLRDEALPLMAVAGVFVVFAVVTVVNGILLAVGEIGNDESLAFIRSLDLLGVTVFTVCGLVTTLLLTIRADETSMAPHGAFESTVRTRLERAREMDEQWWSLLDIRLDDPDEIRTATSTAAFNAVAQRFAKDINAVFPASSDIDQMTATRIIVLVPRSQGGVRELLTELLERVSESDATRPYALRLSASVGWAPVSAAGYDFETLVALAGAAAQSAQTAGGDRWERVRGTV
ncbi:hypothetical protein [Microbacterium sp.]|uniref:hypothetical protein n=1 Tax=Microbacterium sp. TaxID=51671 RepID=UPI003A9572B4